MKKLCFVIPYFGKLPNTFQITLETCRKNPSFDWLLFTDDKTGYDYPGNFHVVYCSFNDMVNRIKEKFSFEICLNTPKKLCDFKPAYGYIFEEELSDYLYWGYCDLDQYFGNLSHFLTDEFLAEYDKIFTHGHMTIFPNNEKSRQLFMSKDNEGQETYKTVFTSLRGYGFDEWVEIPRSINWIAEDNNLKICSYCPMLDVGAHSSFFEGSNYDMDKHEWVSDGFGSVIAKWTNGSMYEYYVEGNNYTHKEVIYVHIQKRHMKVLNRGQENVFWLYPNVISVGREENVDLLFKKIRARAFFHIDENRWNLQMAKPRIKARIKRVLRPNRK